MLHIFKTENVSERSRQKDPAIWLHFMTNEWKSVAVKMTQKHMFKTITTECIYLVLTALNASVHSWSAMSFKVIVSQFYLGAGALSIKPINLYWHKNKWIWCDSVDCWRAFRQKLMSTLDQFGPKFFIKKIYSSTMLQRNTLYHKETESVDILAFQLLDG